MKGFCFIGLVVAFVLLLVACDMVVGGDAQAAAPPACYEYSKTPAHGPWPYGVVIGFGGPHGEGGNCGVKVAIYGHIVSNHDGSFTRDVIYRKITASPTTFCDEYICVANQGNWTEVKTQPGFSLKRGILLNTLVP